MKAIKVNGGIFVDWGCSGIKKISPGYFIPENACTSDTEEEYRQELTAFLEKWFISVETGQRIR